MSEPMYDFRDGILLEKVVYKDDSFNCVYILYYLGCLVLTLMWGCGCLHYFFMLIYFMNRLRLLSLLLYGVFSCLLLL